MTRKQQRIYAIILILTGIILATGLTLYALKDSVTYFYSPSDVFEQREKLLTQNRAFRLGGLVKEGSVSQSGEFLRFIITDNAGEVTVVYTGIVPNLFREGQGVIARGKLQPDGIFAAAELLAKHDENYMPPEVAKALEEAEKKQIEQSVIESKTTESETYNDY